jgi:glycosyltransferase involved in cell wall biosynthesis
MKELPEYRLTVVGGTDSEVRSFEKNASSNVRFLGYRSHQEVREVIEKAEIALIPNRLVPVNSLHTFPMKLVESAAAGKKIVSTDLPILNELKPGSWCSRVLPERPDLFARAIREQSLINQDVELIRSWAKEFRWNFQAERLKAFLNEKSF